MKGLDGENKKLLLLNLLPILFWMSSDDIFVLLPLVVLSIMLVVANVRASTSLRKYLSLSAVNLISNILGGIISTMILQNSSQEWLDAIYAMFFAIVCVGGYLIFLVFAILIGFGATASKVL
ncbi:hypothetical protein [Butyrivibrio sp. VCD2006]|uniref:hypothetical protein n=1 Tax=Butyrivibrio sp. VCD2006 TaxID=1280664 RepID=UPI0004033A73|nr:hypothetical protein [Butyrivibrio sp. VCD2006]